MMANWYLTVPSLGLPRWVIHLKCFLLWVNCMAFGTEIFSREIDLRSFEHASNTSVFRVTNITLACCDGTNFALLAERCFHPLALCVTNLKPNLKTWNSGAQGWCSGSCCCLGTSSLPLTVLQSLLWNFLSFLSCRCNSWPQIHPHILHGSYCVCSHWTTHVYLEKCMW